MKKDEKEQLFNIFSKNKERILKLCYSYLENKVKTVYLFHEAIICGSTWIISGVN